MRFHVVVGLCEQRGDILFYVYMYVHVLGPYYFNIMSRFSVHVLDIRGKSRWAGFHLNQRHNVTLNSSKIKQNKIKNKTI